MAPPVVKTDGTNTSSTTENTSLTQEKPPASGNLSSKVVTASKAVAGLVLATSVQQARALTETEKSTSISVGISVAVTLLATSSFILALVGVCIYFNRQLGRLQRNFDNLEACQRSLKGQLNTQQEQLVETVANARAISDTKKDIANVERNVQKLAQQVQQHAFEVAGDKEYARRYSSITHSLKNMAEEIAEEVDCKVAFARGAQAKERKRHESEPSSVPTRYMNQSTIQKNHSTRHSCYDYVHTSDKAPPLPASEPPAGDEYIKMYSAPSDSVGYIDVQIAQKRETIPSESHC